MGIIKTKLLSRGIFCTRTFYWHRALLGLKILSRALVWNCPVQGGGINCSSPSGFVAVLLLVFFLLDLSSGKGCKTSEMGVALGVMEESDFSIIPASAACILEETSSPRARGKAESHLSRYPCSFMHFHILQSCLHVSQWLELVPGSARWLHICFDLSPYYWAALTLPLELNTFRSAFLQGTLEILLSSASSLLMCWSNQMKFRW